MSSVGLDGDMAAARTLVGDVVVLRHRTDGAERRLRGDAPVDPENV